VQVLNKTEARALLQGQVENHKVDVPLGQVAASLQGGVGFANDRQILLRADEGSKAAAHYWMVLNDVDLIRHGTD
jgi:hypothetical protein